MKLASQRKTNTTRFYSDVESNELTELTRKMGTDSEMESRLTAGAGGGDRMQSLSGKRTDVHAQQCGDCWGERGVRGLNENGNIIQ